MPLIDDIKVQKKVFKKKEYRSWDGNLLEKLKMPPETTEKQGDVKKFNNNDTQHIQSHENTSELNNSAVKGQQQGNNSSDAAHLNVNHSPTEAQPEVNHRANKVQNQKDNKVQLGFIQDVFLIRKLISKLSGNEKRLFNLVINICSAKGTLTTGYLLGEEINLKINSNHNGRETAIKRLVKKGLLVRNRGKSGANGTLNLQINDLIKAEALTYIVTQQVEKEILANISANIVHNYSSTNGQSQFDRDLYSISSKNNKTITNLPEEWLNINIEPLRDIGFCETQLKQLWQNKLNTPQIVQESIFHFAYGLEFTPKTQQYQKEGKNPLNILMGVLRKGYGWVETNYRSPQEIAQEQFLKQKKASHERLKKQEEDAFGLAFFEWQSKLTPQEMESFAPNNKMSEYPKEAKLKVYFSKNVWPEVKKAYLISNSDDE